MWSWLILRGDQSSSELQKFYYSRFTNVLQINTWSFANYRIFLQLTSFPEIFLGISSSVSSICLAFFLLTLWIFPTSSLLALDPFALGLLLLSLTAEPSDVSFAFNPAEGVDLLLLMEAVLDMVLGAGGVTSTHMACGLSFSAYSVNPESKMYHQNSTPRALLGNTCKKIYIML